MTQDTNTASGAAIQRYKIGYHADEWGQRSSTPSGIPDASGSWVRYEDHIAALAAGQATAAQAAPATQQAGAADEAPLSSLPSWEECQLRVSNSDFLAKRVAEGGYGAESDSKVATELHRFLYEYDDQDPYRSAWFRHRLEKVLTECASHGQAPAAPKGGIDE